MTTRRAIRGVLGNFLGAYTSRYSDFEGHWLFGFLIADLDELGIDLLRPPSGESATPLRAAVRIAAVEFADQLQKAGLARQRIAEARLTIRKLPEPAAASINGVRCAGNHVSFWVRPPPFAASEGQGQPGPTLTR
jgi:hypothetical protein